jgi:hypothetical protein
MAIFSYTNDLREQDGKTTDAESVKENIDDIAKASGEMTWENLEPWSLDQFHVLRGSPFKTVLGRHVTFNYGSATNWQDVAGFNFDVRQGNGVYAIASATIDSLSIADATSTLSAGVSSPRFSMEFKGTGGQRRFDKGHSPEVHGQMGCVWAYQVGAGSPSTHHLSFRFLSQWGYPFPIKLRANVVVFVVDR